MDRVKERNGGAQPLNESWWEHDREDQLPPDDMSLLAPYEKTRPSFELLAADACECGLDVGYFPRVEGKYLLVCLWDIWEQEKDPADSDAEKRMINTMQRALGTLDDDTRYIRLQIACFQRCWWEFPANVDVILNGISTGRVNLDAGISCEPPWAWLLGVLRHRRGHLAAQGIPYGWRYHSAATNYNPLYAPRQELARAYTTILTWWSAEGNLDCLKQELPEHAGLAETIYRRLGPPTTLKRLYVEKVRASMAWQAFPYRVRQKDWFPPAQGFEDLMEVYDATIRRELGDKEDVIGRMVGITNLCHHAYFRHLDHQIANIGAGRVVPLPGSGDERKRIHSAVTNYVHVLGSWLARRTVEETVAIWPPCEDIAHRVYDVLRDVTPRKRWLVACLWKKLRENQAKHGRGALDDEPERFAIPPDVLTV